MLSMPEHYISEGRRLLPAVKYIIIVMSVKYLLKRKRTLTILLVKPDQS